MKVYKLFFIILLLSVTVMCSKETTKLDIFVENDYSFSSIKKVAIGSITTRASIPFLKENFRDQLIFHLLKRGYKVIVDKEPFDLSLEVSLYEESNKEDLDDINYIVVQFNFYNPSGKKVSVIQHIYKGTKSLTSGNFIDTVIDKIFEKIS